MKAGPPRHRSEGTGRPAGALGALLVAAHAAGFAALIAHCRGTELAVDVPAPPAAPALALDGALPADLAGRVAIDDTPAGPGLHRRRWSVRYRGGVERAVGAVQLVGPFQDPAAVRCVGRAIVGQALLDDGRAGPGTIAGAMQAALEAELLGATVFPAGELLRIERLQLRWARLDAHPADRALVGDAPDGYVRASASIVFDRVTVPVVVALVPAPSPGAVPVPGPAPGLLLPCVPHSACPRPAEPTSGFVRSAPGELRFRVAARAGLAFDNRAAQWLSDKLGADRLATRVARQQVDDALITALAPPPPFELTDGQVLRFTYCDEPVEIVEGAYGALPFGVAIGPARDSRILPPRLGRGPRPAPATTTRLALDLDLDALNALLYELWRDGFLDRRLADAGLDRRFNADPTVAELLTVRLSPLQLTLPPVVTVAPGGLRLAAEARLALRDGASVTTGRVWGGLDFRFAARGVDPVAVDLGALELSCERTATTLVPCYSDLVAALRGRTRELHGVLTSTFAQLLSDIFVRRVGRVDAARFPADLVIRGVAPTVVAAAPVAHNATLHLELDAALDR
jgi:hypothetical protein